MHTSKNLKERLFQDFPDDWRFDKLNNFLKKESNIVEVEEDGTYQEIGIRSHCKGIFHKPLTTGKDIGNKRVFWIKPDCFIVNIVFAWEQAVAMTSENEVGMIASHRFPMWSPKDDVNIKYVTYFFQTPLGKHLLELASPGGAGRNKTLGQDEFKNTKICIPSSIDEQDRIVEVLDNMDELKSKYIDLYNQKKQQYKYLLDKLTTPNESFRPFNLNRIGDTYAGLSGKSKLDFGSGKPYITYKNIFANTKIDSTKFELVNVGDDEVQNKVLNGDILITGSSESANEVGLCSVYLGEYDELYLNSFCFGYRLKEFAEVNPKYLAYYLRGTTFRKRLFRLAQGSTRYNLSRKSFMSEKIFVPDVKVQKSYAELLEMAELEMMNINNYIKSIDSVKKQLKIDLMSGKIRVMN